MKPAISDRLGGNNCPQTDPAVPNGTRVLLCFPSILGTNWRDFFIRSRLGPTVKIDRCNPDCKEAAERKEKGINYPKVERRIAPFPEWPQPPQLCFRKGDRF